MILKFPKELVSIEKIITNYELRITDGNIENRKEKIANRKEITNYELRLTDNKKLKIKNEELRMKAEENNLFYNVVGDELRVGWFANEGAVQIMAGEPVFVIRGRTNNKFKNGDVIQFKIANNSLCEFADGDGEVIEDVVLKTYRIEYADVHKIGNVERALDDELFIYPNPAEKIANIRYKIANDGFVNISLFNVLGEKVSDIVNKQVLKGIYNSEFDLSKFECGVYICKMFVDGRRVVVKRLVVYKN